MAYPGYGPPGGYPGGGYPGGGYPGGSYPGQAGGFIPSESFGMERREFFIASAMNGKVLDVAGGNEGAGSKVIVYERKFPPSRNQLWFLDEMGVIRSAINGFALQACERGHHVKMEPCYGGPEQQWRFQDRMIMNGFGDCLDVKGASHHNGAEVISYQYNGGENQHWFKEFV